MPHALEGRDEHAGRSGRLCLRPGCPLRADRPSPGLRSPFIGGLGTRRSRSRDRALRRLLRPRAGSSGPRPSALQNLTRPIGRSRLLRGRQLVRRRIGDRGRLDLGAPDLPGELTDVPRRLHRREHFCALPLAGQRHIARSRPPMLGVKQVGVVEGLALALVDRPGIAVPEAGELRRRPRYKPPLAAGRRVERRLDPPRLAVDPGDDARIAVIDAGAFQRVGELHPVADRKGGLAVLRGEAGVRAKLPARATNSTQIAVERVDILVGVGEHEPRGVGTGGRVLRPLLGELRSRVLLASRPNHRVIAREGA